MTCDEACRLLEDAIRQMSEREKALLRISLRESAGLPKVPEPDAFVN